MTKTPKDLIKKLSSRAAKTYNCEDINAIVTDHVNSTCREKHSVMRDPAAPDEAPCNCGTGGSGKGLVDIVVLIDSSTTMRSAVQRVSAAASGAIDAAKENCGADVRVEWLWVDDVKPGSSSVPDFGNSGIFTQSHQKYLEAKGATGPFFHDVLNASLNGFAPPEQGADAVADISKFYDWRDGACRSVFYISDTKLEGYGSNEIQNDVAVSQAINVANSNNVTVFAHRSDPITFAGPMTTPQVDQDYQDLCSGTGGRASLGGQPSKQLYESLLSDAICGCGGQACGEAGIPNIEPCISVSWGDSDCDCMESHDDEVVCITLCNCYSDVSFKNISLGYVIIKDEKGNIPPALPDGTPSSYIYPTGPICFGELGPCSDEKEQCVSRQFVILNRGAKPGSYTVELGYFCYDIVKHSETKLISRSFTICQD